MGTGLGAATDAGTESGARAEADLCGDGALAIARRLVGEAVWHDDRCTWTGDDIEEGPGISAVGRLVHRPVGGDLYNGTSGIAWFLAQAATTAGTGAEAEEIRATAMGALRHALHRAASGPLDTGLYTGALGPAVVAHAVAPLVGDDPGAGGVAVTARGLAEGVTAACRVGDGPAGADPGGADLIQGDAGRVVGLLLLAPATGDAATEAAVVVGERLLAAAVRDPVGWWWPATDPSWPGLCGLGHGSSGPAVAFGMLAERTGDDRFAGAAAASAAYERAWFHRDQGDWPDLRGAPATYPVFWCHGACGIGMARLHAWRLTGDPSALAEAAAALDTATAATIGVLGRPGAADPKDRRFEVNASLCHGVGSVAELHAAAAQATGDSEHLAHGRRLAWWALGLGDGVDPAEALRNVSCGVPRGDETPGLMLGLAGVGALLLRLRDPSSLPSPLLPADW